MVSVHLEKAQPVAAFQSKQHFLEGMVYPLSSDAETNPPIACNFKVGDKVNFTNDYGVVFRNETVTGFSPTIEGGRFVYLDWASWWFPAKPEQLKMSCE